MRRPLLKLLLLAVALAGFGSELRRHCCARAANSPAVAGTGW